MGRNLRRRRCGWGIEHCLGGEASPKACPRAQRGHSGIEHLHDDRVHRSPLCGSARPKPLVELVVDTGDQLSHVPDDSTLAVLVLSHFLRESVLTLTGPMTKIIGTLRFTFRSVSAAHGNGPPKTATSGNGIKARKHPSISSFFVFPLVGGPARSCSHSH